jgi:hypothetical protein
MDSAYVSAIAALAGSVIGGVTSLAATWLSQNAQARAQQIMNDKSQRQDLYKAFIEEASNLYADAPRGNEPRHAAVNCATAISSSQPLAAPLQ